MERPGHSPNPGFRAPQGAGLSVVGLIPLIGDAGGVVGKVVKFVKRFPAKLSETVRALVKSDWLTDAMKTAMLKAVLKGYDTLRAGGMSEAVILKTGARVHEDRRPGGRSGLDAQEH